ncbi:uncharacterized protein BDZ99DRAFT_460768, partial [Mytilinidion resinicola]
MLLTNLPTRRKPPLTTYANPQHLGIMRTTHYISGSGYQQPSLEKPSRTLLVGPAALFAPLRLEKTVVERSNTPPPLSARRSHAMRGRVLNVF